MSDPASEFRQVLESAGLRPAEIIADGQLHRCPVEGKERDRDGAYLLHLDSPASGWWKNFRTGEEATWTARNGTPLTPQEKAKLKARIEQDKKARQEEKAKRHAEAAERARGILAKTVEPDPDHDYLTAKGVPLISTVRQYGEALVLPILNSSGDVQSLQFINRDGSKRLLSGGKKAGGYFPVRGLDDALYIAEGFATAMSVHIATKRTTLMAIDKGNLLAVARITREQHPECPIIIAADNDTTTPGNPGLTAANKAALEVNALVAVPRLANNPTDKADFNDIHQQDGLDAVWRLLHDARPPKVEDEAEEQDQEPKPTRAELEAQILETEDFDELVGLYREASQAGLNPAELKRLCKITAKRAGVDQKSLREDARQAAGDEEKNSLDYARDVIEAIGAENILTTPQAVWCWSGNGVWRQQEDRSVKAVAHRVIPEDLVTKSFVDGVVDLVKTETFKPDHIFDADRRAINVLNGELHWTGADFELRLHCRESYRTTQLNVAYDPNAQCPRFSRFLEEVFGLDDDCLDKRQVIMKMLGYTLLATCELEKFIILIGPGANGKSVLLEVLAELLGRESVCAVQPSQFDNRFQRAHLAGKLANIISEIAEGAEMADAQLKAIVSGELTTAENKHKPPFDFRPYCTCWFGTNHLPHTRDFSDALFRRAFIIHFNRVFAPEEQDPQLKDKLKEELPGILNLALSSLGRLLKTGRWTEPASCVEAKRQWAVECDQTAQFIEDRCVIGPDEQIASKELFEAYLKWAEDAGVRKTLNRRNFINRLSKHGVKPGRNMRQRLLLGIRLDHARA